MAASAGDKTEKATPKRREEARKEGQVARSMEVNSAFAMLGGFALLMIWGPRVWAELAREMKHVLENLHAVTLTPQSTMKLFFEGLQVMVVTTGPFLGGLAVVAIAGSVIQVKPRVTPGVVKPRFSKINPINGFKQKFSTASLVDLAKNVLKLIVVGAPAGLVLWNRRNEMIRLGDVEPAAAAAVTADIVLEIGLKVGGIFVVIALLDWIWQKHRFEKQLRMSKSEVKQESRQQEIAPELKAQQRRRQREMARRRMLSEVPNADVIITNPTHYSIALKYDAEAGAPTVVAKGVDLLAKRIREIADEHGVLRVENKPLARELYARVEVGQMIPPDLFGVVAEVLAYVYRIERRQPKAQRVSEHARRTASASA